MKRTHGMCRTRMYGIWCHMKERCNNPNTKKYHHYGGKGIRICDEWARDFLVFFNWAMGNGYREDLWIERIDGGKDYEPSNCKWATPKEQANNTTRNIRVSINGEIMTISQLADKTGIDYKTLKDRYYEGKLGARLIDPVKHRGPKLHTINGTTKNLKEWSKSIGIPYTTLLGRIKRGISIEEQLQTA